MLPVGSVGAAGIGGAGGLDISAGAIGQLFEVRRQASARLRQRGGERAVLLRRRWRGNVTRMPRAVRRRSPLTRVIFGVLVGMPRFLRLRFIRFQ